MYQENRDMITSTIKVPRATKSPWAQSASRPYGFSTTLVASFSMISSSVQKGRGAPPAICNRSIGQHELHVEVAAELDGLAGLCRRSPTRLGCIFDCSLIE